MEQKDQKMLLAAAPPQQVAWKQWLGAVAMLVVLAGLGSYIMRNKDNGLAASTTGDEQSAANLAAAVGAVPVTKHAYQWDFRVVGGDAHTGADKTQVTLTRDGVSKVVGTYDGHCAVAGGDNTWTLNPNELTAVICWWAGAGDEIGVFLEGGQYIVKHGTIIEGTAEEAGSRGNYETLYTL